MATRGAAAQSEQNIFMVSSQFSKSAGHEKNQRLAKFSIVLVCAVINSGLQSLCKSTSPPMYVVQRCCHSSLVLQQTLSSPFMFSILSAHCQWSKCPDSLLVHLGMCGLLSHYQTAPALKLKCQGFRREQCCLQKHLTLLCLDAKLADGRDLLAVKQL